MLKTSHIYWNYCSTEKRDGSEMDYVHRCLTQNLRADMPDPFTSPLLQLLSTQTKGLSGVLWKHTRGLTLCFGRGFIFHSKMHVRMRSRCYVQFWWWNSNLCFREENSKFSLVNSHERDFKSDSFDWRKTIVVGSNFVFISVFFWIVLVDVFLWYLKDNSFFPKFI